ncbi:hypothetical protein PRVXH_002615 [Proteinivorax hydrogeniformans]|uniref:Molybdopterin-guanine dinucleotide biosynthesis protein B n=1 Tax=Proteinivorax hydrogeniformans TaxID=1826727 RepID=A0AAU8HTP8_9FIRM
MNNILTSIASPEIFSLSIVGMGKNTGKTVTLNYLINKFNYLEGLAVTSVGLDGEDIDQVTYTEKPAVYFYEDMLVATASETLKEFDCQFEILAGTEVYNQLGEIMLIKIKSFGTGIVAGPKQSQQLIKVLKKLKQFGAKKVFVDGAINRKAAAAPTVTDGTILATGAAITRNINNLVQETVHQVNLLSLPKWKGKTPSDSSRLMMIIGENIQRTPFSSAIKAKDIIQYFKDGQRNAVFVPGAVTTGFINEVTSFVSKGHKVDIIAKDGTKIFCLPQDLNNFIKKGGNLYVKRSCKLLGVFINPVSPKGYEFSSQDLVNKLQRFIKLPVVDPLK